MALAPRRRGLNGPTRSLESVYPGEKVRIETILLDRLRVFCSEIGLHEGDIVSCASATRSLVLVEAADGYIIALPLDRARFIRVSDPAAAPRAPRR